MVTVPARDAVSGCSNRSGPVAATLAAIDSGVSLVAITPARCHPSWLMTETVNGPGAPLGDGVTVMG